MTTCTVCKERFEGSGLNGETCSKECARTKYVSDAVSGVAIILDNLERSLLLRLEDMTLTIGGKS